jgi:hypothetical protein
MAIDCCSTGSGRIINALRQAQGASGWIALRQAQGTWPFIALRQAQGTWLLITRFSDQMPRVDTSAGKPLVQIPGDQRAWFELVAKCSAIKIVNCIGWVTA